MIIIKNSKKIKTIIIKNVYRDQIWKRNTITIKNKIKKLTIENNAKNKIRKNLINKQ